MTDRLSAIVIAALVLSQLCVVARGAQRDADVDAAVAAGLNYLSSLQSADGSISDDGPRVATTALSLLAMLASGNPQDVGRHGLTARRAVDYLTRSAPDDGYFGRIDGSRMYGQGIVTLALAEAYGAETDPQQRARIRAVVEQAVQVICRAQDIEKNDVHAGGWRYEPQSTDSDLSVSGWNLLALRAARHIGVQVSRERIERATAYVIKCYRPEQAGFAYQPHVEASAGMTGVGIVTLLLNDSSHAAIAKSAGMLLDQPATDRTRYPIHTAYFTTFAAFQIGDAAWNAVWQGARGRALATQEPDGGWPASRSGEEPGRAYATSMTVLTLTVPATFSPGLSR